MAVRPMKTPNFTPAQPPAPQGPAMDTDEDLGIGGDVEAAPASLDIAALMANPDFAKAIDAMVSARMASAGVQASGSVATGDSAAFNAFLSKFDHMLEVQAEQRPGYIKPLSAQDVDARKQGRADMFGLLVRFKAEDVWPHYLLGDQFYGPSANGPMLYEAGQEIYTRLPPADHFRPLNDPAVQVFEAYKRWVGEVMPIEDLIAQAAADARGVPIGPQVVSESATLEPEVRLVDTPARDVTPKRVLGTIVPEARGITLPRQPGVAPQPAGPIFVNAE